MTRWRSSEKRSSTMQDCDRLGAKQMKTTTWATVIGSAIAATVLSVGPALAQSADYGDRVIVPGPNDPLGSGTVQTGTPGSRSSAAIPITTIPQAFDATFYRHNPPTQTDQTIWGQLQVILGLPFPEKGTNADSRNISRLYYEVLQRQSLSDPWIRTQDLPNPYNGSLLQMQRSTGDGQISP
ncbi:hypothetical protein [Limnothrix redekei]|uniref:Uncharacterized protein n=1 Tax=Limnothrix redekei LRLZ20PSL1 TaxID=3112953 RepID=A0ABW7CFQ9_9CYAN